MDACICMAESFCYAPIHLKWLQHCLLISYSLIQNKSKKKKKKDFMLPVQGEQGGMIPIQETKILHEKKKKKRTKSSLCGILHVCSWHVISPMSALSMHHLK